MYKENPKVTKNESKNRFEMNLGGKIALIEYQKNGKDTLNLTHTEVPPEFEGKGIGNQLVQQTLEQIKTDGKKIIPTCRFISVYIKRHPEYDDLIAQWNYKNL